MRTRKDLEKEFYKNQSTTVRYATTDSEMFALLMETLLDIREILTKGEVK